MAAYIRHNREDHYSLSGNSSLIYKSYQQRRILHCKRAPQPSVPSYKNTVKVIFPHPASPEWDWVQPLRFPWGERKEGKGNSASEPSKTNEKEDESGETRRSASSTRESRAEKYRSPFLNVALTRFPDTATRPGIYTGRRGVKRSANDMAVIFACFSASPKPFFIILYLP